MPITEGSKFKVPTTGAFRTTAKQFANPKVAAPFYSEAQRLSRILGFEVRPEFLAGNSLREFGEGMFASANAGTFNRTPVGSFEDTLDPENFQWQPAPIPYKRDMEVASFHGWDGMKPNPHQYTYEAESYYFPGNSWDTTGTDVFAESYANPHSGLRRLLPPDFEEGKRFIPAAGANEANDTGLVRFRDYPSMITGASSVLANRMRQVLSDLRARGFEPTPQQVEALTYANYGSPTAAYRKILNGLTSGQFTLEDLYKPREQMPAILQQPDVYQEVKPVTDKMANAELLQQQGIFNQQLTQPTGVDPYQQIDINPVRPSTTKFSNPLGFEMQRAMVPNTLQ